MASLLVDRATSDKLIGTDWAMNNEICEILNRDPGQAKDVVKGLKRRLRSKKPKVQMFTLTLLETIVKSCGDIVHMQVADRGILHDMVKIVRKKPEFHVKEKILGLLDTWQEAFGGARAKYPQYFAAYQELLLSGAVFPQRSDRATFPSSSHPANATSSYQQGSNSRQEASESSDLPVLSLTEVQNARGIMDVLSEMLSALDHSNKEGLKQEVIVDLVSQCRGNKQKIVHLVNTTSDEELLRLGLALNDDLQRVLAKHDAIAAGIPIREEKPKPPPALVDVGEENTQNTSSDSNGRSSAGATGQSLFNQLLITGPPSSNEKDSSPAPAKVESQTDLLSWDDVSAPAVNDTLALVPVQQQPVETPASDMNSLVLFDVFAQNTNDTNTNPPAQTNTMVSEQQMPPGTLVSNGGIPGSSMDAQGNYNQGPQLNNTNSLWNNPTIPNMNVHQQQQISSGNTDPAGAGGAFPLPPWEPQPSQDSHFEVQPQFGLSGQTAGMYTQMMQNPQVPQVMQNPQFYPQTIQSTQLPSFIPSPIQNGHLSGMNPYPQQPMGSGQMGGMPYQQQMAGGGLPYQQQISGGGMHSLSPMQGGQMGAYYTYPQQQELQYFDQRTGYPLTNQMDISQRMYGLSMLDRIGPTNSAPSAMPSSLSQPMRAPKQEDKFFGDLVSIAKSKPNKPPVSQVGSL